MIFQSWRPPMADEADIANDRADLERIARGETVREAARLCISVL